LLLVFWDVQLSLNHFLESTNSGLFSAFGAGVSMLLMLLGLVLVQALVLRLGLHFEP
jgi:hypothetical protein